MILSGVMFVKCLKSARYKNLMVMVQKSKKNFVANSNYPYLMLRMGTAFGSPVVPDVYIKQK